MLRVRASAVRADVPFAIVASDLEWAGWRPSAVGVFPPFRALLAAVLALGVDSLPGAVETGHRLIVVPRGTKVCLSLTYTVVRCRLNVEREPRPTYL